MYRPIACCLATASATLALAATASAIEIHQHDYVGEHLAGPPIEVVRVVHVAPPDSDDDGVANAKDECPRVSGPVKGCPPPTPTVTETLVSQGWDTGTVNGSANAYVDPYCESSGDSQVVDSSGTYWGKYQYDLPSWIEDGGDPAAYGSADEAAQDAVAANATTDRWPNC